MLKKLFKLNKILFVAPLMTLMFCFNAPKNDDEKMHIIMINVKNALAHVHYQPKPINDAYSREVYKNYFETIDPAKRYFLQSDMEEFEKHRNQLDDYLNNGNLVFYKQTIDRLYQRVSEIDKMTQDILSKPIDLNEDDELILEPKLKKAPADKQELYNEWKRYIKYNILQEIETMTSKEELQQEKKDSVITHKLKDTINVKKLSLEEKKGNLYMGPLVVGAPAWKSKQISEGDKILKVRSKPNEEAINVVGMLVDEAVRLIRGEKGTEVTLTLQKKDGSVKEVKLIREEVSIEDTFARSVIVNSPKGEKYGYIYLPSFNADFDDPNGRNASDDVKAEIVKLKSQNIKGIILDVRNNGGGSLTEVVDIVGLFMKNGPVVQIKDPNGRINILRNKTNSPVWEGPLVIMQNEFSASASEILAGAMKDYGRAVVVGSPHSYGKGTVQTFADLNRFMNSTDDFGSIKLTIQKFYRVNGKSTQLKGVNADIPMNDFFSYSEIGERYRDNALPWDQIPTTRFTPVGTLNISSLQKNSQDRMSKNSNYQLLLESAQWREKLDKEEKITLNLNKFNKLMKARKDQIKKFKSLSKYDNKLVFTLHKDEQARGKKDEVFAKKSESWLKNLKRDLFLEETVNVISEMK